MDVSCATFNMKEITQLLKEEGIEEGTPEFYQFKCERYRPIEGRPGLYVEREDWPGESSSSTADQQTTHH